MVINPFSYFLQITFCFCSSYSLPGLPYLLCQVQLTLWCGHERFQCKNSPQCLLGLLNTFGTLQGDARPGDGALGLFTLRTLSQKGGLKLSALLSLRAPWQPPQYKYTLEMCTASYSQWKPSEAGAGQAWGGAAQILPGGAGASRQEIPQDAKGASPTASSPNMALIK